MAFLALIKKSSAILKKRPYAKEYSQRAKAKKCE
jgi:hypothetical protein